MIFQVPRVVLGSLTVALPLRTVAVVLSFLEPFLSTRVTLPLGAVRPVGRAMVMVALPFLRLEGFLVILVFTVPGRALVTV